MAENQFKDLFNALVAFSIAFQAVAFGLLGLMAGFNSGAFKTILSRRLPEIMVFATTFFFSMLSSMFVSLAWLSPQPERQTIVNVGIQALWMYIALCLVAWVIGIAFAIIDMRNPNLRPKDELPPMIDFVRRSIFIAGCVFVVWLGFDRSRPDFVTVDVAVKSLTEFLLASLIYLGALVLVFLNALVAGADVDSSKPERTTDG